MASAVQMENCLDLPNPPRRHQKLFSHPSAEQPGGLVGPYGGVSASLREEQRTQFHEIRLEM